MLEPLAEDESVALLASLPGGDELTAEARQRIVEVTAGNPLFAEQLFAYVDERGPGVLDDVPPSVEALLESRLDLLEADERALLQRAAVIGREFAHRALVELSPAEAAATLSGHLFELVRKGLVRPARAPGGEEAFRFHHVLVRDVAYNGLPKADRARLHERFADWLDGEPDAPDEIVGYHLEQAYRYRAELGPPNRRARQLAADAGARLGAAGMRSWRSGDVPATINLLGRATSLLPEDDAVAAGAALRARRGVRRRRRHGARRRDAERRVSPRRKRPWTLAVGHPRTARAGNGRDPAVTRRERTRCSSMSREKAIPAFEELGDDRGLGRAWLLTGWVRRRHSRPGSSRETSRRARPGALSTVRHPATTCLGQARRALYYGPAPAPRAISRCEELLLEDGTPGASGAANVDRYLGGLMAMTGRVRTGRELVEQRGASFDELGQTGAAAYCGAILADVELLAGDVDAARQRSRRSARTARRAGMSAALGTAAAWLAEALYELGDDSRAPSAGRSRSEESRCDRRLGAQIAWRSVRAKVLARRGERPRQTRCREEAVALARRRMRSTRVPQPSIARAEVLRLSGRHQRCERGGRSGIALYEQKGNLAAVERARGPSRSLSP